MVEQMMTHRDKVERRTVRGRHHYYVNGYGPLLGASSYLGIINKPGLVPWARNMALEKIKTVLLEHMPDADSDVIDPESSLPIRRRLWAQYIHAWVEEAWHRPDEIKDQAADLGTQAHNIIHAIITDQTVHVPPELETVVTSFLSWQAQSGLTIQGGEYMVYDLEEGYAGTLDALAWRSDGSLVALEWKTGKAIYPEAYLQVAAYAHALETMTREPITEAWVIRLGKETPEFEAQRVLDLAGAYEAFVHAKRLFEAIEGIKKQETH